MKRFLRHTLRQIVLTTISISGLYNYYRWKSRNNVLIMVYHDVLKEKPIKNHYNYNTSITLSRFKQQVDYLCRHYTPITLTEFIDWKINNGKLPKNPVLFTFDDGHENLYRYVLPVLEAHHVKGVFFIKSDSWGETAQNYCEQFLSYTSSCQEGREQYQAFRSASYDQQLAMLHAKEGDRQYDSIQADEEKYKHFTLEQCKELLHRGHSVQSHSKHHYILSSLDDIKVEVEIAQSKKQLEDVLNQPVNCFAYPFGDPRYDFGDREKSLVQKAGYALGFSGEMKSVCGVTKDEDNYSISRFGDVNHDFLYFQLLLSPIRLVR